MKQAQVTRLFFLLLFFLLFSGASPAQEMSEEELELWFESDEEFEKRGGGEQLEFMAPDTSQPIPFSHTWLSLSSRSVQSGWIDIVQCHEGLDAVPDAEVVYRFKQMRRLRVTEVGNIGLARVAGQSVQLKEVGKGARLCVELEAKVLNRQEDGGYLLRYGPFQRRFLDSYFPMHVVLEVDYSGSMLKLDTLRPEPTKGFSLIETGNRLLLEGWFRGKLTIDMLFMLTEER